MYLSFRNTRQSFDRCLRALSSGRLKKKEETLMYKNNWKSLERNINA